MSPIVRTRLLTVEELNSLQLPLKIEGDIVLIEKGLRGTKLKHPVTVSLSKVLAVKERGLVDYVFRSLLIERPALIPYVLDNQTLLRMMRHFLRGYSKSAHSALLYTVGTRKYADWLGYSPDSIIQDTKPVGAIPDPLKVDNHCGFLNDYLAELQDQGLKFGAVNNYIKAVKTFYRVNGVKVELAERLKRKVSYKDRAPTPEELSKVLDFADLREKVIVSGLALGAFREDTFSKLQYRHVRKDLENNIIPIHVHVEAELTKGMYGDYDTFLGAEAAQYLKLYMEERKLGNIMDKTGRPPETLTRP